MSVNKSMIALDNPETIDALGRSYYLFLMETALGAVSQARALLLTNDPKGAGRKVDQNHGLAQMQHDLEQIIGVS